MGDKTGIEWTDATWNPVTGCTKVSAGCKNCYAKHQAWPRLAASPGTVYFGREFEDVRTHDDRLGDPLRWTRPRRIFVNSMSDLFHENVPFEFVDKVFAVMALAPRHTFQVLTKRPERMAEYMQRTAGGRIIGKAWEMLGRLPRYKHENVIARPWPLPNVWLGTSVEDQASANLRIPHLLATPAAIRWISAEPLLGPVDLYLTKYDDVRDWAETTLTTRRRGLHWVVVGGESGPKSRPMNVAWARSVVAQCQSSGVPVLVKQLGACPYYNTNADGGGTNFALTLRATKGGDPTEWPEDLRVREYPR